MSVLVAKKLSLYFTNEDTLIDLSSRYYEPSFRYIVIIEAALSVAMFGLQHTLGRPEVKPKHFNYIRSP